MGSLIKVFLMFLVFLLVSVASLLLSCARLVIKFNEALKLYRYVGEYPEKDTQLFDANKKRSRVMNIIAEKFDACPYFRKQSRKGEVNGIGNLKSKECESGSLLELYSSKFSLFSRIACICLDYCKIGNDEKGDPKDQMNSEVEIEGRSKIDNHGTVLQAKVIKNITSVRKLYQANESEKIENRRSFIVNDNDCEIRPDDTRVQKFPEVWTLDQSIRSADNTANHEFFSDSANLRLGEDNKPQVLEIASGQKSFRECVEHKSFDHMSSQDFVFVASSSARVEVGRETKSQSKLVPCLGGLRRRVMSVVFSLRRSLKSRAMNAKSDKEKSESKKRRPVVISKPVILTRRCRTSPIKSENLD